MSEKRVNVPSCIFFGDSLTQRGWSYDGGWLSILADNFVRRLDIINRGYSGYNSRMCRSLLPPLFPDKQSLEQCRWFTIFLGANDVSLGEQHVPADEYTANLSWMVHYLQDLGFPSDRILLISLPPLDEAKWGARQLAEGQPLSRALKNYPMYVDACRQAAEATKTRFLNLYEAMIAQQNMLEFFNDGLHFSRKGSEFLAQILTDILEEKLAVEHSMLFPDWKLVDKQNPATCINKFLQSF